MNARQKAKKYKRMYEELLKQSVSQEAWFEVERRKIATLRFERFYPKEFIDNCDNLQEVIANDMVRLSGTCFSQHIDYRTEFCYPMNMYRVYAEIKVVGRYDRR